MPAVNDRVRESSTTVGTGAIALSNVAVLRFQTFFTAFPVNLTSIYYAMVSIETGIDEWEVGIGTHDRVAHTISRDQVLASSNANALVNFSAGTKDVFCTAAGFLNMNLGTWLALQGGTPFL